jgi:hypothetical protein
MKQNTYYKPLPELFNEDEWQLLKELNYEAYDRYHDAILPVTLSVKICPVLPHSCFNDGAIGSLKRIGFKGTLCRSLYGFKVKDEEHANCGIVHF